MKDKDWFAYYDEHKLAFKWFILKYFEADIWLNLEKSRVEEDRDHMLYMMNEIWFRLPDHRFNIIVNPLGWSEFLHLIEE